MTRKALPKADNAIIAEHEAGKHDVYNGGYPTKGPQPATCRDCAKREREAIDEAPEPRVPAPAVVARIKATRKPALKPARTAPRKFGPEPVEPAQIKATVAQALQDPAVLAKAARRITTELPAPAPKYETREAWMLAAVDAMRPWYVEIDSEVPPVRISVGWPGGRSAKGKGVRGQCWASHTVADRIPAIFVGPDQSDPLTIIGIILHEMNHAADDGLSGHRGAFAKNAKALGFLPPWTSSEGKTPELVERLTALLKDLGAFPHGAITDRSHGITGLGAGRPAVQTTRMLKVWCDEDGYTLRATAKWLNVATPLCPICEKVMQTERNV